MSRTLPSHIVSALTRCGAPAAWALARSGYFRHRQWDDIEPRSILLVACHWIGDTFWATRTIQPLARRFPQADIKVATKSLCGDLWNGLLPENNVISADIIVSDRRREQVNCRAIARKAGQLRSNRFDLVIDLTGNRYSAAFSYLLRPAMSIGFDGGELGWLYSRRVSDAERRCQHLSERPLRVIEPLLAPQAMEDALAMPLRPPSPTCQAADVLEELGVAPGRYCVIAPGAGWPAKQWPAQRFIEVGMALAQRRQAIVVVGGLNQADLCNRVAGSIAHSKTYVGQPIGRVVALLSEAAGVLGNDSGIVHLAGAMSRPTAAVFTGETDPAHCGPPGPSPLAPALEAKGETPVIVEHLLAPAD